MSKYRTSGGCRLVILGPGGQEGAVGWLFWGQEASRVGSPADGAPCLLPCHAGGTSRWCSSTLEGEDPLAAPAAQIHGLWRGKTCSAN